MSDWSIGLALDARQAFRGLLKRRAFVAAVACNLAVSLSLCVAAWTFAGAMLFRPYPGVSDDANLVRIYLSPGHPLRSREVINEAFAPLAPVVRYVPGDMAVRVLGATRVLPGAYVSGDYFSVLGVSAVRGRLLGAGDDAPSSVVAVVGYELWAAAAQQGQELIGTSITVDGRSLQVVGVTPRGFVGVSSLDRRSPNGRRMNRQLWVPEHLEPEYLDGTTSLMQVNSRFIGRLGRRATLDSLRAQASVLSGLHDSGRPGSPSVMVEPVRRQSLTDPTVLLSHLGLFAGPVLVLALACANAASLVAGQWTERSTEISTRIALGAPAARLMRQLSIESLVLAAASWILGWPLLMVWLSLAQPDLPVLLRVDASAAVVAALLSVAAACAASLGPIAGIMLSMRPLSNRIATAHRTATSRGKRLALATQAALAVAILATSAQFIQTIDAQSQFGPNVVADEVMVVGFPSREARNDTDSARRFYETLLVRARTLPGVSAVGFAPPGVPWRFGGEGTMLFVWPEGSSSSDEARPFAGGYVSGGFFEAVGLGIVAGRSFADEERQGALPTSAVVTEELASRLLAGQSVGSLVRVASSRDYSRSVPVRVVGQLESPVEPSTGRSEAAIFLPRALDDPDSGGQLFLRFSGDEGVLQATLRRVVEEVDRDVPIAHIGTLHDMQRAFVGGGGLLRAKWLRIVGAIASCLMAAGVFAATFAAAKARKREVGIRLALGASPRQLVNLFLRDAAWVAGVGAVCGGLLAGLMTATTGAGIVGAETLAASKLAQVILTVATAALVSGLWPAVQAVRQDPLSCIRRSDTT